MGKTSGSATVQAARASRSGYHLSRFALIEAHTTVAGGSSRKGLSEELTTAARMRLIENYRKKKASETRVRLRS